ncbi:nucleoid DNA-binding protein [Clostridium moniliforme]|uniref:Nucleoid DNA-binding protein n=1 Tax=Clostridium moniliforme TaxID=39489 RepID=A0ABS4EY37_9CLOT|nr:hypothetical protein [Clostridium moniliforme]MBP1888918.1 nucleoid DNA-binding protein [Clostridium moniliforme]
MNKGCKNVIYKEVYNMCSSRCNINMKIEIKENKINKEKNMDKIYNLLNKEIRNLEKSFYSDEEQLWELSIIKEEAEEIKKNIINKFFNNIVYKKFIDYKYRELYTKIFNNIKNINNKKIEDRDSIMFDFLSEIFSNIYDYTDIILNNFINETKNNNGNNYDTGEKIDIQKYSIIVNNKKYSNTKNIYKDNLGIAA